MKNAMRFLFLIILSISFMFAAYAQTPTGTPPSEAELADKARLYDQTFVIFYKDKDEAKRKQAYDAAREYLQKYEKKDDDAITKYLRKQVDKYDAEMDQKDTDARYTKFDDAVKAKKWAEVFAAGKNILAKKPDDIDTILDMVSIGYDRAVVDSPPVTTFNTETIAYAKMAISKIEAGKPSEGKTYGVTYPYQTKEYPDGKANALGWMNYTIAVLTNIGKTKPEKESIAYFYKASQFKGSEVVKFFDVYRAFGSGYVAEITRLQKERDDKLKLSNNEETEETKQLLAMLKGYADRAIDSYGRTWDAAKKDAAAAKTPDAKASKLKIADQNFKIVASLYKARFNKATDPPAKEIESYLMSSVLNKALPDPNSTVTPVIEAAPVTPAPTTPVKPAPTPATPVKPATTPAKPAADPNLKPAAKPAPKPAMKPAAKPAPKKKGTR